MFYILISKIMSTITNLDALVLDHVHKASILNYALLIFAACDLKVICRRSWEIPKCLI